jgi:hypothetical protein
MIEEISISLGIPTIYFPLAVVIGFTGLKDIIEDRKRYNQDF